MTVGIYFSVCSLIYTILLVIVFFSKKRFESFENKIYSYLVITSLFGPIIGIPTYCFMGNMDKFPVPNIIFSKLYLVYLVMWLMIFTLYIFVISIKNINKNKIVKVFKILMIFLILLEVSLPLYYYNKDGIIYSYGPAANSMYLISTIFIVIVVYCLIKNIKYITEKKFIPISAFLIIGTVVMIIQKLNPGLLLLSFAEAFITFLMYFTIENPDMQMINELYKNKELVESTYEDKSNFLFEMTQEVRNPLFSIKNLCNEIKIDNNIKSIKNKVDIIDINIKQLDFVVNDILNVSSLNAQKVKIIDNRYNLKNLYDEVITKVSSCIPKNVEFITNISNNVPYLYGDSIKLKQVITSILLNAVKKTSKGYIELSIDTIEKYDVCRLIITMRDSGCGITIDRINEILAVTGEIDKNDIKDMEKLELNMLLCQKIIKLLGGNLMIKSEIGKGTEISIVLDQRIYKTNDNETILNNYESSIYKNKKVLIVSQNKEEVELIKNKLSSYNISYSHILYGMDAIDRIKSGKKYDYIIVDDDMKEMSGYSTLKELKNIKNFKIPVIIMLSDNKKEIKDHYLNDGFSDYILVSDMDNELKKIIEKY